MNKLLRLAAAAVLCGAALVVDVGQTTVEPASAHYDYTCWAQALTPIKTSNETVKARGAMGCDYQHAKLRLTVLACRNQSSSTGPFYCDVGWRLKECTGGKKRCPGSGYLVHETDECQVRHYWKTRVVAKWYNVDNELVHQRTYFSTTAASIDCN